MARGKGLVATLTAVAITTGSCSAEKPPQPDPSPSQRQERLVVPSPPPGFIGLWPSTNQCSQPGVYALSQDPTPGVACAVGETVKKVIDGGGRVDFVRDGGVDFIRGLGVCVYNMVVAKARVQGETSSSFYAGVVRVGQDGGAETLFFPYQFDAAPVLETAPLRPTDYTVYAAEIATNESAKLAVPIGVLVGQAHCKVGTPSP